MKQKGITLNIRPIRNEADEVGEDHFMTSWETPLRKDAFALDYQTKIDRIEEHFREIMITLGLDLNDDSLKGTPRRVAKMYVEEVISGLDPKNRPVARLFENKYNYDLFIHILKTMFNELQRRYMDVRPEYGNNKQNNNKRNELGMHLIDTPDNVEQIGRAHV